MSGRNKNRSVNWISEEEWALIEPHLLGKKGQRGGVAKDNRLFVEAVFLVLREKLMWRELPEAYGDWRKIHRRFSRWRNSGIWENVIGNLIGEKRYEWLWVNGTLSSEYSENLEQRAYDAEIARQNKAKKNWHRSGAPVIPKVVEEKPPRGRQPKLPTYIWPWMYMTCRSDFLPEKMPKAIMDTQSKIRKSERPMKPKDSQVLCTACGSNRIIFRCMPCGERWEQ